jgi:hypothetical protein
MISRIFNECLHIAVKDRISYSNKNKLVDNLYTLQKRCNVMITSIIYKDNLNSEITNKLEKLQVENTQLYKSLVKSQNEKINIKKENTKLQNALNLLNHEKWDATNELLINKLNNEIEFCNWLLATEYNERYILEKTNNKLQNDYVNLQNDYVNLQNKKRRLE